jgi:hypothetical protein
MLMMTSSMTTLPTIGVNATDITRGALSSSAVAGIINYNRVQQGSVTVQEAVHDSLKIGIQGGIATGSAMSATYYYSQNKTLAALTALSIGAMGVYAVEKLNDKLKQHKPSGEEA